MATALQHDDLTNEETGGTCHVWVHVDDDQGVLGCWLPDGHSGPHYDEADQLWWERREA